MRSLCLLFLNDFNRCFLFKIFVGFPFQVTFVFPPSHPFSSWSLTLSRALISFVWSLFSLSSIVSTGVFSFCAAFSISFPMASIQVIRCRLYSIAQLKWFPCSFVSRQFILPECSRHLRRFVCVPINSRLSPHSNISIVPVLHLSVHHPFPTVFSL